MSIEKSENLGSNVLTDHFHSRIVEVFALLSNLTKKGVDGEKFKNIKFELSNQSQDFIKEWQENIHYDFIYLLSFLLPIPYFQDVELFLKKLRSLSNVEFLYHFFGEDLDLESISELLKDPARYLDQFEHLIWENQDKKESMIRLIRRIDAFRSELEAVIQEIYYSSEFNQIIVDKQDLIKNAINEVKTKKLEPLSLAQFIMGKTFKRTSDYQIYYFLPSIFMESKMRIFKPDICVVIYSCQNPLHDYREQSKNLEVQLKAISDQNRLILLRMIANQKLYGAKIAEFLGVTTATVSHHIDILKKAGFILEEKIGNIKYFSLNKEKVENFSKEIQDFFKQ